MEGDSRREEALSGTLDPQVLVERLRTVRRTAGRPIASETSAASLLEQLHDSLRSKEHAGLNCVVRIQSHGTATAGPFGRPEAGT